MLPAIPGEPQARASSSAASASGSSGAISDSGRSCSIPAFCRLSACSSATRKSCRFVAAFAATSRSISSARTSSIRASVNVCMSKNSPSAIASLTSSTFWSRIRSAMRELVTISSTAATRPPWTRGSSRWLTTPRSTPARIERICSCLTAGKNSISRLIVSAASIVCIVDMTRWPDSAALSAVSAVSASRSSPTRITSGSWRRTRRTAERNDSVSRPTSRWLTMQPWSRCRISIGSSIVSDVQPAACG